MVDQSEDPVNAEWVAFRQRHVREGDLSIGDPETEGQRKGLVSKTRTLREIDTRVKKWLKPKERPAPTPTTGGKRLHKTINVELTPETEDSRPVLRKIMCSYPMQSGASRYDMYDLFLFLLFCFSGCAFCANTAFVRGILTERIVRVPSPTQHIGVLILLKQFSRLFWIPIA